MKIMDLGDLSVEAIELRDLCDLRDRVCAEIAKREAITMRIKGHIVDFLDGREAAKEDLRIFEVRTAGEAYDLNADEIAEETVEDGWPLDPDELADVFDLKVDEKVQLGTFVVVTRKPDRDREGMAEAGPDPRREAFK